MIQRNDLYLKVLKFEGKCFDVIVVNLVLVSISRTISQTSIKESECFLFYLFYMLLDLVLKYVTFYNWKLC